MLVCPLCQSENLLENKFCQQCGTSLQCQACPDCGAQVAFTQLNCPQCDRLTGKLLTVVLAQKSIKSLSEAPEQKSATAPEENQQDNLPIASLFSQSFLDSNQRYQLLTLPNDPQRGFQLISSESEPLIFRGSVLDCRPLQPSSLLLLPQQVLTLQNASPNPAQPADPLLGLPQELPDLARPYLSLQQYSPTLPSLSAAWQIEGWDILVLPDRSSWQTLGELITSVPLPIPQIIYWLSELATLWGALEPWASTQSLLIDNNLRIDEDQSLGLSQLYSNSEKKSPDLLHLTQFWKTQLLAPYSGEGIAPVLEICDRVIMGGITNWTELRSQLQDLAESEPQIPPSSPTVLPEELPPATVFSLSNDSVALEQNLNDELLSNHGEGNELPTEALPMRLFSLSEAGASDCGQQRQHNEDYFKIDSQVHLQQDNKTQKIRAQGLYLLCDGMGGHAGGEEASVLAVHTLHDYFHDYFQEQWRDRCLPTIDVIKSGIWQANQKIYEINQQRASIGVHRMGTTLAMLLLQDNTVAIAHVGDSRIYRISRRRGLEQLTVDHEVGQKAIQSGLDPTLAYARPEAYQLTQALGPCDLEYVLPDVQYLDIQEDTLFLLCSDGLSDHDFVETHWETLLLPLLNSRAQLDLGLNHLIEFANQHNGHDNITGLLVRLKVRPN
jgi:protein phosphatase